MIEFHVAETAIRWNWTVTLSKLLDEFAWGAGFMLAVLLAALIIHRVGKS